MRLEIDPERSLAKLVDEAGVRFDLDPNHQEFLLGFYRDRARPGSAS